MTNQGTPPSPRVNRTPTSEAPDARKLRVLIVDDEPLARTQLRALLADEADLEVIGECGNGTDAVTRIEEDEPDLVLLDIQNARDRRVRSRAGGWSRPHASGHFCDGLRRARRTGI